MDFITKYTFSKLCRNLDIKKEIDLQTFKDHIYNDEILFYIFNKFELKYLFNYKNLLENDEQYIAEYYQYVPKTIDTKSYVFEKPRKLKYHLTGDCEFLNSDYVDFHIPKDITDLGLEAVNEFRTWFKSKEYAQKYFNGTLSNSKVVFDFNMKFPSKYNIKPLNENYKLVLELENSNTCKIKSEFEYDDFKENIKIIKRKRNNRFGCGISKKLTKFDYLLYKSDNEIKTKISEIFSNQFVDNYGLDNLRELFKDSKKYKKELLENLVIFFKWSFYNRNLAIGNRTLDKFGLECCNKCAENNRN
jgi:hypothetical protein